MQQESSYQTEHVMFNAFKDLPALEDLWGKNKNLNTTSHLQ